jgi:hypothetical protein
MASGLWGREVFGLSFLAFFLPFSWDEIKAKILTSPRKMIIIVTMDIFVNGRDPSWNKTTARHGSICCLRCCS